MAESKIINLSPSSLIQDIPASVVPADIPLGISVTQTGTQGNGYPLTYGTVLSVKYAGVRCFQLLVNYAGQQIRHSDTGQSWRPWRVLGGVIQKYSRAFRSGVRHDKHDTEHATIPHKRNQPKFDKRCWKNLSIGTRCGRHHGGAFCTASLHRKRKLDCDNTANKYELDHILPTKWINSTRWINSPSRLPVYTMVTPERGCLA